MITLKRFLERIQNEFTEINKIKTVFISEINIECQVVVQKGIPYVIELDETILEGTVFQKIKMSVMVG